MTQEETSKATTFCDEEDDSTSGSAGSAGEDAAEARAPSSPLGRRRSAPKSGGVRPPEDRRPRKTMGNVLSCFHGSFSPSEVEAEHKLLPVAPRPPTDGRAESVVQVKSVDLHVSQNAKKHHTDDFDLSKGEHPILIVRRGDPFKVTVELNREYNPDKDALAFVFTVKDEETPSYTKNTVAVVPVGYRSPNEVFGITSWAALIQSTLDKSLDIEITPPVNVIVGDWVMDIDSKIRNDDEFGYRYTHKDPIYILFNPWCRADTVYMDDTRMKFECVLMDTGLIWRGNHTRLRPTVWKYGQFDKNVLECCVYLLRHVGKFATQSRSDPVKVSRHISAVVNEANEGGVLYGSWKTSFPNGTHPAAWTGSAAILQQYLKSKKPVKYAQCWVFSGVTTTVFRALGIPARSVTNYSSAHDTHNSLTVDKFYDEHGKSIETLNKDVVWNFHVWNEVWMTRPDLEPGDYSGWQAIDSTPQEASDGVLRCGPASVKAIKRAEILKPYDGTFIFAEVNADEIYWRYQGPMQPLKLISKTTDQIGRSISTKAAGRFEREDITDNYKYPESTAEERNAMLKALRKCNHAYSRYYLNDDMEDVGFDFELVDDIVIGSPFTVKLKVTNKSPTKNYTAHVIIRVEAVHYTGNKKKQVKDESYEVHLKPNSKEEVGMLVTYEEYEKALLDQALFNISTLATIKETKFEYFAQDDFRVRMPDVKIEIEGEPSVNKQLNVRASFKNPLPKPLNKAYFVIEGPGLSKPLRLLPHKQKIAPGEEARVSFQLVPESAGPKAIIAKFFSKELDDVDGFKAVDVTDTTFAQPTNSITVTATA
ncbi:annulin [Ixodes scapularis]|nr:annulin [Ixodes scapularis]